MISQRELDQRIIDRINAEEDRPERIRRVLQNVALAAAGVLTAAAVTLAAQTDTHAGEWESMGTWKTTGYCNCRKCSGKWAGGPTASGRMPEEGRTVAVGRMPFGTRLLIDGHEFVIEDRGVTGKHVDIYYEDHSTAHAHGVQYKQVFIWRD